MLGLHSAAMWPIAKAYQTKAIEVAKLGTKLLLQLSDELPKLTA
jgi:hypothetical protein